MAAGALVKCLQGRKRTQHRHVHETRGCYDIHRDVKTPNALRKLEHYLLWLRVGKF